MEEEFLGGFHGEMQSEKGSSGSFFNGDLKVSMGKRTCPWEDSLDLESFHVSHPAGTSGFFVDPSAASSHVPLSSSSDWTQLLICGSRMEDNLGAMDQEHLISRTHLLQQSNMNSENLGFHLDGFMNEEIPSQINNRFPLDGLSSHFSTSSDVKATGCSEKRYDGGVPVVKKPRVEAPSPLPSFKVRKEKLGDRITALQQLVSPFGKTDTASVLYEAIEYIKLLHDQVAVLSTPYLKLGSSMQHKPPISDKASTTKEGPKRDLQSRGLCLVPISNTIPIINDTTTDFWTPAFGTSYKLER